MFELIKLGLPVVLGNLGTMVMGMVDILFVGRVNAAAIGAVGVGTSVFAWFMMFGFGLASGMEFLVSHAHGARDRERQCRYLIQGLILSFWIAVPFTGAIFALSHQLAWFGVNPEVIDGARKYTQVLSFSLFPVYFFNVLRLFLTAMGQPRPAMVLLIFGNVVNALLNYVLVLGHWGFPPLGAEGAAWATLVCRVVMMICMGLYVFSWDRKNGHPIRKFGLKYHADGMRQLWKIGLPASLQMLFEVGVFALATTLAARLTTDELAAHQVVLNIASLTFMVPLGIGSATAVRVGQAMGRGDQKGARIAGWQGYQLGVGFMAFSCLSLLIFSDSILGFFTSDVRVIELGKSILFIAALFQLSDGAQTVGTGALRGFGDTRGPMVFNLLGHWTIGVPVGAGLCFYWGLGLRGLWIGLSLGLTFVAALVLGQWVLRTREVGRV